MIETVLDLYANRGGFSGGLDYLIEKTALSPFSFYEQFADFFFEQGYQHRSHRKEDLYRILFRFAASLEESLPGIGEETRLFLERDLEENMNFDAVKKFHKKGWEI